jgi:predicted nucleotidyltransferase
MTFLPDKVLTAFEKKAGFSLDTSMVYACYVGSQSHGTYVPKDDPEAIDDIDILCIVVPPPKAVLGLKPWKETEQIQIDEWDIVIHSVSKFVRLLLKGNPNMLGALWVREQDRLHCDPKFQEFLTHRKVFSSKESFHSFAGYASEQLRKMSSSENAYQGYMGEKRKKLVDKFGYDCKNAAHLVRLLRMCIDFLRTGELVVYRDKDGETIRSIKRGEWALNAVTAHANELFASARAAYEVSTLPGEINLELTEKLLLSFFVADGTVWA